MSTHRLADDLEEIFYRAGDFWEAFRDRRVFVTGGTGFFGKWLLESLVWADHHLSLGLRVVVLTRDPWRLKAELPHLAASRAISFITGDVRTFSFPDEKFAYVFHLATTSAEATFAGEGPLEKFTTSAYGTQRVLEFAARCGVEKFLLTSSGNAYGPARAPGALLAEDDRLAPDIECPESSALGEGKRASELLARIFSGTYGFEVKLCRCFSFIGPYLQTDLHYAAGNFIRDAVCGRPVQVKGSGRPLRSFLYPTDLIVWLLTLLFRGVSCRLYNVGSDEVVSIRELAEKIARASGGSVVIEGDETRLATSSPDVYVPSISRITSELGVRREVSIETAIARTLAFHSKEVDSRIGCLPWN